MTGNERRLLLVLEAVAAACLLGIQGSMFVSEARSLQRSEQELDAASESSESALGRPSGLAVGNPDIPEAVSELPAEPVDPEACAELIRGLAARNGLDVARYALLESDDKSPIVELSVRGSASDTARILSGADAIRGWRVISYSLRKERDAGWLETTFRVSRIEEGRMDDLAIGVVVDPTGAAKLFGQRISGGAPSMPAPEPSPPVTPVRRIAYVGRVEGSEGSSFYFKDLDSGRVVRLIEGGSEAAGWRLAGRDGKMFLVEVQGTIYKVGE